MGAWSLFHFSVIVIFGASLQRTVAQNHSDSDLVGWTSSPNSRGTSDILWSCLFTLLACTWTILHLNVPHQGKGIVYKTARKALCMFFAILAPELITAQACSQWKKATNMVPLMRQLGLNEWTITHSFFAEMGAIAIQFDDGTRQTINGDLLIKHIEVGSLHTRDISFSEADIEDRSKSDIFAKAITLLQSVWFISQCIARAAQHLALSQLEIATGAYVVCAVISYFFWRKKPQGVDCQTIVGKCMRKESLQLAMEQYSQESWHPQTLGLHEDTSIRNFIFYCMGVVFCALHCIAWNFHFPTEREAYLWRVFAVCSTGAAGLLLLNYGLIVCYFDQRFSVVDNWSWLVGLSLMLLYLVGRVYLVFSMFYILRSMPSSVYQTVDWTVYFPHWM